MATLDARSPALVVARGSTPARAVVWLGVGIGLVLAVLTAADVGGAGTIWENASWTVFDVVALVLAVRGARASTGSERRVRRALACAAACWLAGQLVWMLQIVVGLASVPAPSDVVFLSTIVPVVWALELAARDVAATRGRTGLRLDAGIVLLATATLLVFVFGDIMDRGDVLAGVVLLSFPIGFLSVTGAGVIAVLATRTHASRGGLYALLAGTGMLGAAYVPWVAGAPEVPTPGTWSNYLFSAGAVMLGIAGATFEFHSTTSRRFERVTSVALDTLPVVGVAIAVGCLVAVDDTGANEAVVGPLGWLTITAAVVRQLLLVRERAAALQLAEVSSASLEAAERGHRELVERIPAILYVDERRSLDEERSTLTYLSPQIARLGYTPDELLATPERWYELVHPDDLAMTDVAERRHFLSGEPLIQTFRMRARDGRDIWMRDEAILRRLDDGRLQSHGVLTDVTAQVEAEAALRTSEEQQRRIIETASSAYVAIGIDGRVTEWNERASETFGWRRDETIGRLLSELIIPESQRQHHEAGLRRYAEQGAGPLVGNRVEVIAVHRSGREFPVELTIWPVRIDGRLGFSALIHDITERRRLEGELRHLAFHDSLTGLANRALFVDRLGHAIDRRNSTVAIALFDIDDFKLVNDGLGHQAGDELLVQVARRLAAVIRPGDTAARLGGDEFAVLFEDAGDDIPERAAERILRAFDAPFDLAERRIRARASLGVSSHRPGQTADEVIRDADAAMYAAKRSGKGRWQRFHASMAGDGLLEIELRADLRDAVESGLLAVAYQPIVDLGTGRPVGVEALARWRHPTRGDIPPSQFIALAEGSDLIAELGRLILRRSCRDVQSWKASPAGPADLHLSVNLSARQLLSVSVVDDVRDALADSGLDPSSLTLEITEGVLVEEAGASLAALEGLKALGVRIAIDDFGTGYSSLSYLSRLPIDVLKVDQSFIATLGTSRQASALVRSILQIGQTLHLDTIAEGIETVEQLEHLRRLGARLGQGYLFARPMPPDDCRRFICADPEKKPAARRRASRVATGPSGPTGRTASRTAGPST